MPTPRRRVVAALARGLVGIAAVAFVAHHLSWREVWGALRRARVELLVVVVAINGLMLTIRAARLQVLLSPARASLGSLLRTVLTSSAINNVFPLRAGDVARLYMLEASAGNREIGGDGDRGRREAPGGRGAWGRWPWSRPALPRRSRGCSGPARPPWAVAVAALVILRRMADGRSGRIPGFLRAAAARIAPGMSVLRSSEATAETLGASLAAWSCEIAMIILCARAIGSACRAGAGGRRPPGNQPGDGGPRAAGQRRDLRERRRRRPGVRQGGEADGGRLRAPLPSGAGRPGDAGRSRRPGAERLPARGPRPRPEATGSAIARPSWRRTAK